MFPLYLTISVNYPQTKDLWTFDQGITFGQGMFTNALTSLTLIVFDLLFKYFCKKCSSNSFNELSSLIARIMPNFLQIYK